MRTSASACGSSPPILHSFAPGSDGQSHKPGDKAVMAITESPIRFVNRIANISSGAAIEGDGRTPTTGDFDLVSGGEFVGPLPGP
jgi:hypothetical protein